MAITPPREPKMMRHFLEHSQKLALRWIFSISSAFFSKSFAMSLIFSDFSSSLSVSGRFFVISVTFLAAICLTSSALANARSRLFSIDASAVVIAVSQIGKGVGRVPVLDEDMVLLKNLVGQYATYFDYDAEPIFDQPFTKLQPLSLRPYGRLYAY